MYIRNCPVARINYLKCDFCHLERSRKVDKTSRLRLSADKGRLDVTVGFNTGRITWNHKSKND